MKAVTHPERFLRQGVWRLSLDLAEGAQVLPASVSRRQSLDDHVAERAGPGIGFDATDFWPLTITPSTTRPKRAVPAWIVAGAVAALGAASRPG